MTGVLFVAAIAAAFLTLGRRWLVRRQRQSRLEDLPGANPNRPIAIERYDEIEETMRVRRCVCGGSLRVLGEGEPVGVPYPARFVRAACSSCEEEQAVYFDLSRLMH